MEEYRDSSSTPKNKGQNRGTDSNAIASRLESFYGNLHASSPRDVTPKKNTPWRNFKLPNYVDENNNNFSPSGHGPELKELLEEEQQKIKFELPQDYQGNKNCICFRPPEAYECGSCHHFIKGRLSKICEKHPSEVFLMDVRQCPYCMSPLDKIEKASLTWEEIRNIEEADLPSDNDI